MRKLLLSALLMSACTSIVPSTLMRLDDVSPTDADPAGFAVDLSLPTGLDIVPGSAMLTFVVRRSDTNQMASGRFALENVGNVFRVAPADLQELRGLQATARQWKAKYGAATEGSLSINLTPCTRGDGPDADARVNIGLQIAEGGRFLPLVRNGRLSAVATPADIEMMAACP